MNLRSPVLKWMFAGTLAFSLVAFLASAVSLFLSVQSLRAPIAAEPREPRLMHWSDIESPDAATFAANLRKIGCSERTIAAVLAAPSAPRAAAGEAVAEPLVPAANSPRAFVAAEAGVAPAQSANVPAVTSQAAEAVVVNNEPATESIGALAVGSERSPARHEAGAAMRAANAGGVRGLASGAGGYYARNHAPAASPAVRDDVENMNGGEEVITAPEGTVAVPVAFQPPTGAESDIERAQIDNLQQQFVQDIGGTNQDPSDPDYQAAWNKAQRLADERYAALFGSDAMLARQQWRAQHPEDAGATE